MSLFDGVIKLQQQHDGKTLITFGENKFLVNDATVVLLHSLQNNENIESAYEDFSKSTHAQQIGLESFLILSERLLRRLHSPKLTTLTFPWIWAKFNLVSDEVANVIACQLKILFSPVPFYSFLISSLLLILYFLVFKPFDGFERLAPISTSYYIVICAVSLLSHEFGHLAACQHFKVSHQGINGGMFLFIPATFVELKNVWQAKKYQRVLINFAGVYFQLLLGGVSIALYLVNQSNFALTFAAICLTLGIFQLVPFRNSDGYWIVLDIFFKGTDQVFGHQKSLLEKHELSGIERLLRLAVIALMSTFVLFLFYRSIPSAKAAVSQINTWLWIVSEDGFTVQDLNIIKLRDFAGLMTCFTGVALVGALIIRKAYWISIKKLNFKNN